MPTAQEGDLHNLGAVVDRLRETSRKDRVSVGDVLDALGPHSFSPLLLVAALVVATPLSGIPGVSSVGGVLIAILSFEMLMSFDEAHLSSGLKRRSVDAKALRRALDKARPVVDWFDRRTRRRLSGLFHRPLIYVPMLICLLSGLSMPFLEFIPFSSSIVASGVVLIATSLLTRDGLFFLLALLPYLGAALLLFRIL